MPRKRVLTRNKRVKAVARKRVGSPKPARVLNENVQRSKPKHKRQWQDEVDV